MWKPWILVAVGSVMALGVAGDYQKYNRPPQHEDVSTQEYSSRAVKIMENSIAVQDSDEFVEDFDYGIDEDNEVEADLDEEDLAEVS